MKQKISAEVKRTEYIKRIVMTGMFTALLCVMAQISIPTNPIPFTLSVFAIFLTGAMLPPRSAFFAVICYVLLGAFGLPVFAGWKGGAHVILGPTGGFIMAYPIMSFVVALSHQILKKYRILALIAGMVIALFLCYIIGSVWFVISTKSDFSHALSVCVYPFVLFDFIKIGLAVTLSGILLKNMRSIK